MPDIRFTRFIPLAQALLLGLITVLCFLPGLGGPFLHDDFVTLSPLQSLSSSSTPNAWIDYLRSGSAGPTGRPIALVTFALQAADWPNHPAAFKWVNLGLHLVLGLLVATLLSRLNRSGFPGKHPSSGLVSIPVSLVSALWLLHPLQVTTALYPVQRMTQLASLFILLGLVNHLWILSQTHWSLTRSLIWRTLNLGLFTLLATFSKENGALLPVYLLVVESTLLGQREHRNLLLERVWRAIGLWLPLLLLVGYLIWLARDFSFENPRRAFSVEQRFLSQPRVLFEYLGEILFPWFHPPTLFRDDIAIAIGILQPFSTLPALIGVLVLGITGWVARNSRPVFAFAALWFLGGHLLESTTLLLELHYSHRNHLPMLGPLVLVGWIVAQAATRLTRSHRFGMATGLILSGWVLVASLAGYTLWQSDIWSDRDRLARYWLDEYPTSLRTQRFAYQTMIGSSPGESNALLEQVMAQHPNQPGPMLDLAFRHCSSHDLLLRDLDRLTGMMPHSRYDAGFTSGLQQLHLDIQAGKCGDRNNLEALQQLLETAIRQSRYGQLPEDRYNLLRILAELAIDQRRLEPAMNALEEAGKLRTNLEIPLRQAEILLSAGLREEATKYAGLARQRLPSNRDASLLKRLRALEAALTAGRTPN